MKYTMLLLLMLLSCTPYTKAAVIYQNEIQTKEALDVGYSQWYRAEAAKCLDKTSAHGQSSIYEGKPVIDRVSGMKQVYNICIAPKDKALDEVAKIIDEINTYDKNAGQVLIDVAKGVKPRSALLGLPVALLPKILRLKLVIEAAEKGDL